MTLRKSTKKLKVKIKLKIIKTKNGWVDKFLYGNMVRKYESEQHVWNVNKLNQRIYHPRQFVKHKFVWSYNVVGYLAIVFVQHSLHYVETR